MAITVRPRRPTRITRGKSPVAETEWIIRSTDRASAITREEAEAALLANTPDVEAALLRNEHYLEPTASPYVWHGSVLYRVDPIPSENAPLRWSGTTRGGSSRIFRSLATVGIWTRPEDKANPSDPTVYRPARDYNGAIEVDEDNNVQGTDVVAPNEEWTVTVYLPAASFTASYRRTLRKYSPCVNSSKWKDFAAGEVLFQGADWDYTLEGTAEASQQLVAITYYFRAGYNEALTIGDLGATDDHGNDIPIVKRAHDHIWFEWEETTDTITREIVRRPSVARIEQLYPYRSFSALGLGDIEDA